MVLHKQLTTPQYAKSGPALRVGPENALLAPGLARFLDQQRHTMKRQQALISRCFANAFKRLCFSSSILMVNVAMLFASKHLIWGK